MNGQAPTSGYFGCYFSYSPFYGYYYRCGYGSSSSAPTHTSLSGTYSGPGYSGAVHSGSGSTTSAGVTQVSSGVGARS